MFCIKRHKAKILNHYVTELPLNNGSHIRTLPNLLYPQPVHKLTPSRMKGNNKTSKFMDIIKFFEWPFYRSLLPRAGAEFIRLRNRVVLGVSVSGFLKLKQVRSAGPVGYRNKSHLFNYIRILT